MRDTTETELMPTTAQLERAIWAIADDRASDDDLALFHADERTSLGVVDRLIFDAEDGLESVRKLNGEERHQVVADFADTLRSLRTAAAILRPMQVIDEDLDEVDLGLAPDTATSTGGRDSAPAEELEPGEVQLQASWSAGQVIVWAAGRATPGESNELLAARLEAIGGPPVGWQLHPDVSLPGGHRAEALAIPMKDALGWLVAISGGEAPDGVGASVLWLGQAALEGVRVVAGGSVVPTLKVGKRSEGGLVEAKVRWAPALIDGPVLDALAASMPGPVVAVGGGDGRAIATSVITAAVETIVTESVERMELPAQPPRANSATDLGDTLISRMDGSPFEANANLTTDLSKRLGQWSRTVTTSSRPRLVVRLEAPDTGGVWLASVEAPNGQGSTIPIDTALRADRGARPVTAEWNRLSRLLPRVDQPGLRRRGQAALSQDEAWEFMSVTGPTLAAVGFDVRVPALSKRKATASLRLFAEAAGDSVVGAHQLSNVAWSVLFDDVELTASEVAALARQARPLVKSQGRWVEVDRVDLQRAAEALAEREATTQLTGAEILRHSMGLDGAGLSGGVVVHGSSWANDIVERAGAISTSPITKPDGFIGELRSYQADALAWLGFLRAAELGGCLALDMGLGKTPTVLAHLAHTANMAASTARDTARGADDDTGESDDDTGGRDETALVIAPAAVVGNWAAEAARFTPGLRVVVHHGASRSSAAEFDRQIAGADIVITTYATAVRDIDMLAPRTWGKVVLDEAQAIKNPASETSQQLRRLTARSRLALTGTPIENGLGDLWAILDFTNPGLVGTRPAFIAQMSGDGEAALRALNGMLLFRRTKSEPEVAAELPDKIDELDHCTMTAEQIGLYQAVLDALVVDVADSEALGEKKQGAILAAITALKQICNHPAAYRDDGEPLSGRSGKLTRLEEIVESVFAAGERLLVFTHFASWGRRLARHLTEVTGVPIACYDGSLPRGVRDAMVSDFQNGEGPGAMVLSLKAGGTGLNLTAANHVVLYDRWWNPAVEDQARDRAWRIGQSRTVISHRLVCPGTVDERVEEVVAGKRHIADLVLPRSSSIADLSTDQLKLALGLRTDELLAENGE